MTNNKIMAAVISGSLLAGGALGLTLFGPGLASAQTTGTTSAPAAATAPPAAAGATPGTFSSNEDPAHEAGESAQREADEDSGKAFGGPHGSNEDAAHEASESPAREAEEDAANASSGASSSTAPATSDSTLQ